MIRAGLDPLSGKAVAPRKPKFSYVQTPTVPQGITTLDATSAQNLAAQQALEAMMKGHAPPGMPSMPGMPGMAHGMPPPGGMAMAAASAGLQLPAGFDVTKLPPMPAGMNLANLTNVPPPRIESTSHIENAK